MRHFIEPNSFSLEEQLALLDLADRMEADPAPYAHLCDGRILATLFYEPSTRTRLSFESARHWALQGHSFLPPARARRWRTPPAW